MERRCWHAADPASPFRTPHRTIGHTGLMGGGNISKPGKISLAHRGVLFLDEFPEFGTRVLEVMRQPMEDKVVTISRAKASPTFSANFQLAAAMNPFPLDCTQSTIATVVFRNSILAIRLAMDYRKFPRKPEARKSLSLSLKKYFTCRESMPHK